MAAPSPNYKTQLGLNCDVPQELVDHVIDHHHADRETLKACSLVSRAWTPSSQLHLFESVSVPYSAPDFLAFLDASPRIAQYIRRLRFFPEIRKGRLVTIICPLHMIPPVLHRLTNLTSFELDNMCTVCLCKSPIGGATTSFSLGALSIQDVADYDRDAREGISQLLNTISSVKRFDVAYKSGQNGSFRDDPQDPDKQDGFTRSTIAVQETFFDTPRATFWCRALLFSPSVNTLRTLVIVIYNLTDLQAAVRLAMGSKVLHHLYLEMGPFSLKNVPRDGGGAGPARRIVLPELLKCDSLHTISLTATDVAIKADYYQRVCGDIADLLMYVPPTVKQVDIISGGEDEARKLFMANVDREVYKSALEKMQGLQEVRVFVKTNDQKVLDEIEADLVQTVVPRRVQLTVATSSKGPIF
ncbi:hypothetical protein EIP91_010153 [Steccherinum ochraceum]|uniref:F-box domain-containing protein n=1 Tax=Steccherinum ochraceum TaxID=92696 RepID=A0A4V2MXU1_9APHY|nr:hypothetical protein EIP91_010153 [Steccherinum ochraceum]